MMNGAHGASHTSKGMITAKLASKYFIIRLISVNTTTASAKHSDWPPS